MRNCLEGAEVCGSKAISCALRGSENTLKSARVIDVPKAFIARLCYVKRKCLKLSNLSWQSVTSSLPEHRYGIEVMRRRFKRCVMQNERPKKACHKFSKACFRLVRSAAIQGATSST